MNDTIQKILIANRGEVAVRIIRTAREMGIDTVVVYSDQDAYSQPCDMASEAVGLNATALADTYLNVEAMIDAAHTTGADAVHPGYGFLSENADCARAVTEAGLTWIGPSAQTIETLGDKIRARAIAQSVGVPIIPGGPIDENLTALDEVNEFPVLVKKADTGGGRGILRFDTRDELAQFRGSLRSASELRGSFIEKMVTNARHIETQCLRDFHGHFHVLTTRDCSIQRRNQKVIEEAPAPFLTSSVEQKLRQYSQALFEAGDYRGVGTCEFLVTEDAQVYFLEINPRLQVEHTVSEEVTGMDLVRTQIRIAQGEEISEIPAVRGHSFEVRVTSENPADDLMPQAGVIESITWPAGPGVRVDSFIRPGDEIGTDYDSLIAKIIVTAPTRHDAHARMNRALEELHIEGVPTCTDLILAIINDPDFLGATAHGHADAPTQEPTVPSYAVHTKWLENSGILDRLKAQAAEHATSPAYTPGMSRQKLHHFFIEIDGQRRKVRLPDELLARIGGAITSDTTPSWYGTNDGRYTPAATSSLTSLAHSPRVQPIRGRGRKTLQTADVSGPDIFAPIQGVVVAVNVNVGDVVNEGDQVVVLESMKMEKSLMASAPGRIHSIDISVGDTVNPGQQLVSITPEES